MGKDDEAKGSASKADLMEEHVRLVKKEKDMQQKSQEVNAIFLKLDQAYKTSKGTFSIQRYGQLKDMIKEATSESSLQSLQQVLHDGAGEAAGRSGLASLLHKAKEFSGESQKQTKSEPEKATGKTSFMKKLKNLTGFSNDPITDEDVMTADELMRDNGRKKRSIQQLTNQLSQCLSKLEKLKHDYEASKSHAPPKRYQDLKEMIKLATDAK
ncbi:uncharacterized protein LOC131955029 [Physella acuta]|uniref:uncharacterized protein LOC131955029 n=1 Tax=Physella acuta TaxID=109671 RepID=UPI0027DAD006|nr:uncharacterized protein LOC131955029 [Physella acuta]XP_059174931.1 uncharacterized protein LOC131955029 [Physella acuta]XP_059174932.1 uncharacterized protein LOC131955029 [Physella acuta]